ncbi:MAG: hypothetical protein QM639_19705 [Rhodocyclaceae bacterium]
MFDSEIHYKTAKGRAEMADARSGLSRRLRTALVMINGKTPWSQLARQLAALGDPAALVAELSHLGLVESDHELPPTTLFPEFTGNGRAA